MKKGFIVAIDGPVASGKGTVAHKLAQLIGAINFSTGGVWRAYAYLLMQEGLTPSKEDIPQLRDAKVSLDIREDGSFEVFLNGQNVTEKLNDPDVSRAVSKFGLITEFAQFVISRSREMAEKYVTAGKSVVMEGRQIGTIVFPDADVKLFLTANVEVRARRRYAQYIDRGLEKSLPDVIEETKQRDEQDMNREFGALSKDPEKDGYTVLDNSLLTEDTTVQQILDILQKKSLWQKN